MLFLVLFLLGIYASAAGSQDFGFVCGFGLDREAGAKGQSRQSQQLRPANFSFYQSGTVRPLILFGKLNRPDDPFSLTQLKDRNGDETQSSADLLNPNHVGSLAHYFKEMSYGALTLEDNGDGVERRWFAANRTRPPDYGTNCVAAILAFAGEVFADADDTIDFSDYDRDGDGVVDLVILYIPLEFRNLQQCGSHGRVIENSTLNYMTEDSVSIQDDLIVVYQRPSFPWLVGVTAHEYGHVMNLPELYDDDGDSAGIGLWGLMGHGPLGWSWKCENDWSSNFENDLYSGPTPLSVWSRYKVGWITEDNGRLVTVESDTDAAATLHDINSQSSAVKAYKIPVRGSDTEYFLVANRQNTHTEHSRGSYYDDSAPASGLAIWHIDDGLPFSGSNLRNDRRNDNENHKRVDLECADGLFSD
ncbi:MAG: M6 family metalloprotease domain-containing protein [Candidatus Latescibacteria bacterium]|nr:M6 family metalloprotease domain-containing protein [Candidatus Latescibacterota bacterium]